MTKLEHGFGPLGATCGGCLHGPWPTSEAPEGVDMPAVRFVYGSTAGWFCGLTAARIEPCERACGMYDRRNGQVTESAFPHMKRA